MSFIDSYPFKERLTVIQNVGALCRDLLTVDLYYLIQMGVCDPERLQNKEYCSNSTGIVLYGAYYRDMETEEHDGNMFENYIREKQKLMENRGVLVGTPPQT